MLHHAEDDQRCYDEVLRVLKPGGKAFLMLYRRGGPKYRWQVLFRQGILGGGLRRHNWDVDRFVYSVTDAHDGPGAPISRHYRRHELDVLFKAFRSRRYRVSGNAAEWDDLPFAKIPLTNLLPRVLRRRLVELSGAYWLIELQK